MLLQYSPEMDARRIKNKIGKDFFDQVSDYLMKIDQNLQTCKEIKYTISKKANDFIKTKIDTQLNDDKLIRNLFRKSLTLEVVDKISGKDGLITYEILDISFKQVQRVKDFSGDDGLVFEVPNISFNDIAGHNQVKNRLKEITNFLKDPSKLKKFDISIPKGMLLYGVPGTGKTMLAKAFANEADLPFIETTGTEIKNIDIMKNIFSKAREYAPSIIFIDEMDSIGNRDDGKSYIEPINQLLTELNGFSDNPDDMVFVISATNHKDKIDSGILRSGRIDLHVEVNQLDREARAFFIDKILQKPTTGTFDKKKLLMYTTGMTGADLSKVERESSLYVIRNDLDAITQDILIEQINSMKYGEKLSHLSLEDMMEETAIHEAGHAVISRILMPHIKIEQITVTPRGNALGFVSYNYEESQNNLTIKDFKDRICVAFAGRLSQIKKSGNIEGMDTGASNDLAQATRDAYYAIAHCGMDEEIGYININGIPNVQQKTIGISDNKIFENKIEQKVQLWLKEQKEVTEKLVEEHWNKIERLSKLLLKEEVVYENDVNKIIENK